MVLSTVTNLDVFVEGVTAHWPLLLWENFVKKKNGFQQDSYSSHHLENMACLSTNSFLIIQELRSRMFLQITSFFLMYC